MKVHPDRIVYSLSISTGTAASLRIRGLGPMWVSEFKLDTVDLPLASNHPEDTTQGLGDVLAFLRGLDVVPYLNGAGGEENADIAQKWLKEVCEKFAFYANEGRSMTPFVEKLPMNEGDDVEVRLQPYALYELNGVLTKVKVEETPVEATGPVVYDVRLDMGEVCAVSLNVDSCAWANAISLEHVDLPEYISEANPRVKPFVELLSEVYPRVGHEDDALDDTLDDFFDAIIADLKTADTEHAGKPIPSMGWRLPVGDKFVTFSITGRELSTLVPFTDPANVADALNV